MEICAKKMGLLLGVAILACHDQVVLMEQQRQAILLISVT